MTSMTVQSSFDEILESIVCPFCGTEGMISDGGYDYCCPNCDYEGTLEDEDYEEE